MKFTLDDLEHELENCCAFNLYSFAHAARTDSAVHSSTIYYMREKEARGTADGHINRNFVMQMFIHTKKRVKIIVVFER